MDKHNDPILDDDPVQLNLDDDWLSDSVPCNIDDDDCESCQ